MSWLKNLLHKTKTELSNETLALLKEHLKPLADSGSTVVQELMLFVREGSHEKALDELRKFPAGSRLFLGCCETTAWGEETLRQPSLQRNLLHTLGEQQAGPEVYCRLGRLWQAAAEGGTRQVPLAGAPHGTPPWLETLYQEVTRAQGLGTDKPELFSFLDAPALATLLDQRGENPDAITLIGLGLYNNTTAHFPVQVPESALHGFTEVLLHQPEGVATYFQHETRADERLRATLIIEQLLGDGGWSLLEESAGITKSQAAQMALSGNCNLAQSRKKDVKKFIRQLLLEHGEDAAATLWDAPWKLKVLDILVSLLGEDFIGWLDQHKVATEPITHLIVNTPWDEPFASQFRQLKEWPGHRELLQRHADTVSSRLAVESTKVRASVLGFLDRCGYPAELSLEALTDCATSSAKTVRQAALPLLLKNPPAAMEGLFQKLAEGNAGERAAAVELLAKLDIAVPRERIEQFLETETSKKVRAALEELLHSAPPEEQQKLDEQAQERILSSLPAPRDPELGAEAPVDFAARLETAYKKSYDTALAAWQHQKKKPPHYTWMKIEKPAKMPADWPRKVTTFIANWNAESSSKERLLLAEAWTFDGAKDLENILLSEDLTLAQTVRLWLLCGILDVAPETNVVQRINFRATRLFANWLQRPGNSLRDLGAALRALGFNDDLLAGDYLAHGNRPWGAWPVTPEQAWPFVAEHVPVVREYLATRGHGEDRRFTSYPDTDWLTTCLDCLRHFPELPQGIEGELWQVALGTGKSFRVRAQDCLTKLGHNVSERVIAALTDGKKDIRFTAAQWLERMPTPEAAPVLTKALEKERQEEVRAAMLAALEASGVSIEEFFGPVRLLNEAKKKLAKGLPANLSFLNLGQLPKVLWENGKSVNPLILHWELAKALKVRQVTPNPLSRRLAAALNPADAEAFGQWVLEAWLARDQAPMEHAEALDAAKKEATSWAQWKKSRTVEEWTEHLLLQYLSQPRGSAIKEKGLLALVSAFGGAEVAAPIHRYLKKWYGHRMGQCKALLEVLSHVDHPQATQVLVSVSTRFRTAGIRKEALRLVEELAERKGWTHDQLADRTIPSAGLEEDGKLLLDTGQRQFTLLLDEELKLTLLNPAGKKVKAISGPNKEEDPDQFKAAKKQLSASRKELKDILKLQQGRLYEAMCTQRTWQFEEWDEYLNRHPIVGRFCSRLVWVAENSGGERIAIFRPLEDHSLTDADDEDVALPANATLRLTHLSVEPKALAETWREHLADYEVKPLFPQFDGEVYTLPEELRDQDEIRDHEGWLIDSRKLHSLAGKLGWVRAQAEDGGFFNSYFKHFQTLGFKAALIFSGLSIGDTGDVALVGLQFIRVNPNSDDSTWFTWFDMGMRLDGVPPVLLSECHGDYRRIAEAGSGYDPEWKKNVNYWGA